MSTLKLKHKYKWYWTAELLSNKTKLYLLQNLQSPCKLWPCEALITRKSTVFCDVLFPVPNCLVEEILWSDKKQRF